jgi:hypothetical protein
MAESVKISNLPAATSITPQNIVASVDGANTQTSKVTVEQIQDLGPGIDTVSDEHVKNGHIPASKSGFATRNAITVGRSDSILSPQVADGSTNRIQGYETYISNFVAATLFTAESGTDLRTLINDSSTFPSGVLTGPGSEENPSYRFGSVDDAGVIQEESQDSAGNPIKSGFYADSAGSVSFTSQGKSIWRIQGTDMFRLHYRYIDGTNVQPEDIDYDTEGELIPSYAVVASCSFTPAQGATQLSLLGHGAVARFFGEHRGGHAISWNSSVHTDSTGTVRFLGSSGTDRRYVQLIGNNQQTVVARYTTPDSVVIGSGHGGRIFEFLNANNYVNIFASRHDPYHRSWTGVTTNYHSPGDNYHSTIGSGGTIIARVKGPSKTGSPWIGQLYFSRPATQPFMKMSKNIASIQYNTPVAGTYTFTFQKDMPDECYQVFFNQQLDTTNGQRVIMTVTSKSSSSFTARFHRGGNPGYVGGTLADSGTAAGTFDISVVR